MSMEISILSRVAELTAVNRKRPAVLRRLRNRHSNGLLIGPSGGEPRYFAKYGAHFSGHHAWDAPAELQGYRFASGLKLPSREFRAVKPLCANEKPGFIVCEYIAGNTLHQSFRNAFASTGEKPAVLELADRAARWTSAYARALPIVDGPHVGAVDFTLKKLYELIAAAGNPGFELLHACAAHVDRYLTLLGPGVGIHGDYGPHNIMIDKQGKLTVIDIGFQTQNYSNRFDDACDFLLYLERMLLNPLYKASQVRRVIAVFLRGLQLQTDAEKGEFRAAYIKKTAAHGAWFFNRRRKKGRLPGEFIYGRWARNALGRIRETIRLAGKPEEGGLPYAYGEEASA